MNLRKFYLGKAIGFLIVIVLVLLYFVFFKSTPASNVNENNNQNENINAPINVGGGCQYKSIAGTAEILSIESAPTSGSNCPIEPQLIKFVFTSDDLTVRDIIAELRINAGMNPSLKWVEDNDITVGKTYRVERQKITSGTCTPVVYKFLDLDVFPATGCN